MKFFPVSLVWIIPGLLLLASCQEQETPPIGSYPWERGFDLQGHRGCRGLLPENSLPAFHKALQLGVSTLEMDVVISRDSQVLLSHEPFLSHEICLDLQGAAIADSLERTYNLFRMDYDSIRAYDCGSKVHPRFPEQQKMAVHKPLLRTVIDSVEHWWQAEGRPPVWYNIETKSSPQGDGIFHPDPETFARLLLSVIAEKGVMDRVVVQSFDPRTLQVIHRLEPGLPLALLVENENPLKWNLEQLGFFPTIYSPDYHLVDATLLDSVHELGMALIPWTVNDSSEMQRLHSLGADGLITDYPDRIR